jgi:hypothetical protein
VYRRNRRKRDLLGGGGGRSGVPGGGGGMVASDWKADLSSHLFKASHWNETHPLLDATCDDSPYGSS